VSRAKKPYIIIIITIIIIIPEQDFPSVHPARWERTLFIGGQHWSWHDPRQRWACRTETNIRCIVCILCETLLPCSSVLCTCHNSWFSYKIHIIKIILINTINPKWTYCGILHKQYYQWYSIMPTVDHQSNANLPRNGSKTCFLIWQQFLIPKECDIISARKMMFGPRWASGTCAMPIW